MGRFRFAWVVGIALVAAAGIGVWWVGVWTRPTCILRNACSGPRAVVIRCVEGPDGTRCQVEAGETRRIRFADGVIVDHLEVSAEGGPARNVYVRCGIGFGEAATVAFTDGGARVAYR